MIIGVPKEIKEQEHRVGLVPSTATTLVRRGHKVLVQKGAGMGSGYPDQDYVDVGATIVETAEEVFRQADMIVKVKEPLKAEYALLRKGQILFTYLHLAASRPLTDALLASGVTGRRLRNDSGGEQVAVARTDERDRGPHVRGDGRVLSGEAQ